MLIYVNVVSKVRFIREAISNMGDKESAQPAGYVKK
jgi:hypothetical protein